MVDLAKVQSLLEPVVSPLGCELLKALLVVEHGRRTLRLIVEKESGLTVEDCRLISREVETLLEVQGVMEGRYDLEVSSPGLDRPLVKEADFVRFTGKMATIRTKEPIDGRGNYKGILKGMEDGKVIIEVDRQDYKVPFEMISKSNLVY